MTEFQKQTVGTATTSMIFGILGFVLLGIIGSIVAVICGHIAKAKIRKNPEQLGGEGMALAGLVMGYIGIALNLLVILILVAIAIPATTVARERALEVMTETQIHMLDAGVNMYEMDTGSFPKDLNALKTDDGTSGWSGPYYQGDFTDTWGSPFVITVVNEEAVVSSIGPDMLPGTADDISAESSMYNTAE